MYEMIGQRPTFVCRNTESYVVIDPPVSHCVCLVDEGAFRK